MPDAPCSTNDCEGENAMRKNRRIAAVCGAIAAVCFAIVSYGHFYRGRTGLGWLFGALAAAQAGIAVVNAKRAMDGPDEGGDA